MGVFNTLLTINLYHIYMNSVLSHTEISSNPFCLIQNCPWLVFIAQGFFFVILLSLNLYFWRIDGFPFSFHLIVIILFFCTLCLINFYFIDLVREAYKKYEVLYMMLFIVFLYLLYLKLYYLLAFFGQLYMLYLLHLLYKKVSFLQTLINYLTQIQYYYLMQLVH